jgi:nicotinamide riboside kinase
MEKGSEDRVIRIVLSGPESTGKTNISEYLAKKLGAEWIPEYARYYMNSLSGRYNYADVEHVARTQVEDYYKYSQPGIVIFDTWLIITKVWFLRVYKRVPDWLEEEILNLKIDLFLLCEPDIPWETDPLRENGGKSRLVLYNLYKKEILRLGVSYSIIKGHGEIRNLNALHAVENFLKELR